MKTPVINSLFKIQSSVYILPLRNENYGNAVHEAVVVKVYILPLRNENPRS